MQQMECGEHTGAREPFSIEVREEDTRDLLVLAGQLDASAAVPLRATAQRLAGQEKGVAIEWERAEHVGVSALQVLLALAAALEEKGKAVAVASDNPDVRGFLELAGLSARFPVCAPRR
jgi:anti-anti-sigma factor